MPDETRVEDQAIAVEASVLEADKVAGAEPLVPGTAEQNQREEQADPGQIGLTNPEEFVGVTKNWVRDEIELALLGKSRESREQHNP